MLTTEDRLAIRDLLALYGHVGGGLPRRPEDVERRPGRCPGDRLRSSLPRTPAQRSGDPA